jgi:D-lactate dehydrogenase
VLTQRKIGAGMYILAPMITEADGQYLMSTLPDSADILLSNSPLSEIDSEILSKVDILLPFIHSAVGLHEMDLMPQLKLIATRSTGYDHIDLAVASVRGIAVANVPGYGEIAVAEHTIALMLALSRKICRAYTRTRQGDYAIEGLDGFDLYGKTLGVIGAGSIGLHVIHIAQALGMHVMVYDVIHHPELADKLGFCYASLEDILLKSDVVTLHAPAMPDTYHLINQDNIMRMKRGAILINTARGTLVETGALLQALEAGILGGVALDALECEDEVQHMTAMAYGSYSREQLEILLQNYQLSRRDDVVITPHIAFNSQEAHRRILDVTVENVEAFLQDKPYHRVNAVDSAD